MTRLPATLQPLWPLLKRVHRASARGVGELSRRAPGPVRGLVTEASQTSGETVLAEPATSAIHRVGEATTIHRRAPVGRPADHWYFRQRLEHRVPEKFVLELERGMAVGPHVAVVTAAGRLDAETSHYFGIRTWREHPVFLNPRPGVTQFDGTLAVLSARATGANYYHFLVDALPRLGMLAAALPGENADAYLLDRTTRYQRELIGMLGLDSSRIFQPAGGRAIQARRLLVPSLPNVSTLVSPETTEWLRSALPPKRHRGLPERIYLTRGQTRNTRRVVGESAVLERLQARGFVAFDPGAVSVQEQIDQFAAARVVVAPHGAGLTNLAFARPGVRVLELFAPGYVNGGYWSMTDNIAESVYRYLVADTPAAPREGTPLLGVMNDIRIRPEAIQAAVDDLLEGL